MARDLPYLASYKNVGKLFGAIAAAKQPDSFTHQYLRDTLGIKGSGDRALVPLQRGRAGVHAAVPLQHPGSAPRQRDRGDVPEHLLGSTEGVPLVRHDTLALFLMVGQQAEKLVASSRTSRRRTRSSSVHTTTWFR